MTVDQYFLVNPNPICTVKPFVTIYTIVVSPFVCPLIDPDGLTAYLEAC